jgi:F0F1-type ATP synthase assembly protein I
VSTPAEDQPPGAPGGPDGPRPLNTAALVGLGTSSAVLVGAGVVLGILADSHWHSAPLFLFVGLVVGIVAAVGSAVTLIRRTR